MALPAPYAPPWKRLGEDLVAILAWLRLKARELWRRNGEGSLPVPPFWPRPWGQLFWPLLMVAVLLAALALLRPWLVRGEPQGSAVRQESAAVAHPPPPALSPSDASAPGLTPQPTLPSPEAGALGLETQSGPASSSGLEAGLKAANPEPAPDKLTLDQPTINEPTLDQPTLDRAPPASPPLEPAPVQSPTEADLLRAEWAGEDPDQLIESFAPEPANATLTLQLDASFLARPLEARQRWAERWQQRAANSGYRHLRLADGMGRLVGREAQVGNGMILLQPSGPKAAR